jgi:hypothetical protein
VLPEASIFNLDVGEIPLVTEWLMSRLRAYKQFRPICEQFIHHPAKSRLTKLLRGGPDIEPEFGEDLTARIKNLSPHAASEESRLPGESEAVLPARKDDVVNDNCCALAADYEFISLSFKKARADATRPNMHW